MRRHYPLALLTGTLLLGSLARPASAENWALLVGVDEYQDRNNISRLYAAAADAKGMAKALHDVGSFKPENVRLLVSDGETKPTGANILFELEQLGKNVKTGDTVVVFFSGHGMELEKITYMLPYDTDARSSTTLKRTGLPTSSLLEPLQKLNAKALVLAFDMCRNDPLEASRSVSSANRLGERQAKDLVLKATTTTKPDASGPGPKATITLFSCSPKQRSYEWRTRGRGYFCYYLEEGLRQAAADAQGTVRVKNLVAYVEKAVYGAVQRDHGQEQTPYYVVEGVGANELVLASGRKPGAGGETAVPTQVGPSAEDRYNAAMQRAYELLLARRYDAAELKFEEALELKPDSARAHHALGLISDRFRRDYARAETLYRKAMSLDPKDAMPVNNLAVILHQVKKDHAEAERLYKLAMQLNPELLQPVNNLAFFYQTVKGDAGEAERLYKLAIEMDPKDAHPVHNLGFLYQSAKRDYPAAETQYRRALDLEPDLVLALTDLGSLIMNVKRDFAEAERLFRQAQQHDAHNAAAAAGLGTLALLKKDYPEAERLFRKAVDSSPQNGRYHADLALALSLANRKDEALTAARKAIDLGFKGPHAAFQRLQLNP